MKNSKNRIEACLAVVIACEKCASDCIVEGHKECIALCKDCADICLLYAQLEARESVYAPELRALYAKVCKACAAECGKHISNRNSCEVCVNACLKCVEVDKVTSGTSI